MTRHASQRHSTAPLQCPSLIVAALMVALAVGCAPAGRSTQQEVCDSYRELAEELLPGGLFDNPIFRKAGSLGDVASRYEVDADVMADGQILIEIGDSDTTSNEQLERATMAISALCGQRSLTSYTARIMIEGRQ